MPKTSQYFTAVSADGIATATGLADKAVAPSIVAPVEAVTLTPIVAEAVRVAAVVKVPADVAAPRAGVYWIPAVTPADNATLAGTLAAAPHQLRAMFTIPVTAVVSALVAALALPVKVFCETLTAGAWPAATLIIQLVPLVMVLL